MSGGLELASRHREAERAENSPSWPSSGVRSLVRRGGPLGRRDRDR
jgi:hypothetical protein